MGKRVMCEVPFCGRSTAGDPTHQVWLCADHWKLVDPNTRRVFRRAQKQGKHGKAGFLWTKLVRQAVEAAAGIG